MAKKQLRRSISMQRALYDAVKQYSEENGIPLVRFVEGAVRDALAQAGRPVRAPRELSRKYWNPEKKRWTKTPVVRSISP